MEDEISNKDFEKQEALIGRFIISFESINDWIRFIIPVIIFPNGVNEIQRRNIDSLLTDLGADQLRLKFDSLIFDSFSSFHGFIKVNNILSKKVSDLIPIRNSIAHGSYRLGWKNFNLESSNSTFSLRHSKSTKKGYQKRSKIISVDDLDNLIKITDEIISCYHKISVIIKHLNIHKKVDLAENKIIQLTEEVNNLDKINLPHLDIIN